MIYGQIFIVAGEPKKAQDNNKGVTVAPQQQL